MSIRRYNKLVRDRIPDIIRAQGNRCRCEVLSEADYLHMLDAKLWEELEEYLADGSAEELADLLEVSMAVAAAHCWQAAEDMPADGLQEALSAYQTEKTPERLSALQRMIFAEAAAQGVTAAELERIRAEKSRLRGGFEKRLLLTEVIDSEETTE